MQKEKETISIRCPFCQKNTHHTIDKLTQKEDGTRLTCKNCGRGFLLYRKKGIIKTKITAYIL